MIQIKKEMLAMKAAAFPVTGEAVCAVEGDMKGNELRDYANLLAKRAKRVLVLSGGDGSWRYVLTDAEKKAKDFGFEMQTLYQGKGRRFAAYGSGNAVGRCGRNSKLV